MEKEMFIVVVSRAGAPIACCHGFSSKEYAEDWARSATAGFDWVVLRSINVEE